MRGFEVLEHTADVGLRAWGDSLADMFVEAALGLEDLALDRSGIEEREQYPLEATGEDLEALLVNWLNEIVYCLDGKRVAISRIAVETMTENRIVAVAWGEQRDNRRHEPKLVIKAATFHQLRIASSQGQWSAEVYLDI
ncbi:MAG: archease [Bryobacterales bacterium]|nr:archease [Bryobacterales bacterium]